MPTTPVSKNVKLPPGRHPHGDYVLVPRDPWMTDSILGPNYGAKVVFVPKPDPVTKPLPSISPATVTQPHPYAFEKHPAHAARAKWLKEWEEKKRNSKKPVDGVASPLTSEDHSQASERQSGGAQASPGSPSSACVFPTGSGLCTSPRTNQWDGIQVSPLEFYSDLSPLAKPCQPSTPEEKK